MDIGYGKTQGCVRSFPKTMSRKRNGSSRIIFLPSVTCSHPMTEVIKTRTLFTFKIELRSRRHLVLLMHEFVLHFGLTKDLSKPQWVG